MKKKKKNSLILGAALLFFHFPLKGIPLGGEERVVGRVAMIGGICAPLCIFICFMVLCTYIHPYHTFRFVFGDTGRGRIVGCLLGEICDCMYNKGFGGFNDLGERIGGFFLWS